MLRHGSLILFFVFFLLLFLQGCSYELPLTPSEHVTARGERLYSIGEWCGHTYNTTLNDTVIGSPRLMVVTSVRPYTDEKAGVLLVRLFNFPIDGELRFEARDENGRLVARLSGAKRTSDGMSAPSNSISVPFSLKSFERRTERHILSCTVYEGQESVVTSIEVPLWRVPFATYRGSVVKIDYRSLSLAVNGVPFVPSGSFVTPPYTAQGVMSYLQKAVTQESHQGLNMVHVGWTWNASDTYDLRNMTDFLDRSLSVGLHVSVSIHPWSQKMNDSAYVAVLKANVQAVMHHPALLFYYMGDELDAYGFPVEELVRAYHFVKQLDPYHPILLNNNCNTTAKKYSVAADILSVDPYPIGTQASNLNGVGCNWCNGSVLVAAERVRTFVEATDHQMPVFLIPQAFQATQWLREPSAQEERVMTYLSVLNGARGWMFYGLTPLLADPASTHLAGEELRELTPWLSSPEASPSVRVETVPPLPLSVTKLGVYAWQRAGRIVIVVVNPMDTPFAISILLDVRTRATARASVLFENRMVALICDQDTSTIHDFVNAMGTRVYLIDANSTSPAGLSLSSPSRSTSSRSSTAPSVSSPFFNPGFEFSHNSGIPDSVQLLRLLNYVGSPDLMFVDTSTRTFTSGYQSLRVVLSGLYNNTGEFKAPGWSTFLTNNFVKSKTNFTLCVHARTLPLSAFQPTFRVAFGPVSLSPLFTPSDKWTEFCASLQSGVFSSIEYGQAFFYHYSPGIIYFDDLSIRL